MIAFILSRPRDYTIATACRERMHQLGWTAHILIDPTEWETPPPEALPAPYGTQNRGMFGNDCALAIMDGILNHSRPGEIVMKMDCDIWLSPEAAEWFANATHKARAMKIHYRQLMPWGGMWSTTREHLQAARAHSTTYARCRCPESGLNLKALHQTEPSLELMPHAIVQQWTPGEEKNLAATLPITRRYNRTTEALALFLDHPPISSAPAPQIPHLPLPAAPQRPL